MERRPFLAVGASLAVSGCLGGLFSPSKRIARITLANNRRKAYEIAVIIERGDEEVFTDNYELGTDPESSTVRIDEPVDGRGRYTIRFRAGDQTDHIYPSEYEDMREDCLGIRYELHRTDRSEEYPRGTRGFDIRPVPDC